jgi:hypothetical protein
MIPLLICSYKGRYLEVVLRSLVRQRVPDRYAVLVWDNGGAAAVCARQGVQCLGMRDRSTGEAINVGKAVAMRHLVDQAGKVVPEADCYVCMDDDVIVDPAHLDALVSAARRPGMAMIGPRFHPFNTRIPDGGSAVCVDGLRLHVHPRELRTVHKRGAVAGTLFAISRAAVSRLPWAPSLYPILLSPETNKPVIYWTEDARLDIALAELGLLGGYLDDPGLTPAIHLPELNREYEAWKFDATQRFQPATTNPF